MGRKKCALLHPAVFLGNPRKVFILNGRPVGTRTPDRGDCQSTRKLYKTYFLCVGLWVGNNHGKQRSTALLFRSKGAPLHPSSLNNVEDILINAPDN